MEDFNIAEALKLFCDEDLSHRDFYECLKALREDHEANKSNNKNENK